MEKNKDLKAWIIGGAAALAGTALALTFRRNALSMPSGALPISNFDLEKYLGKWYEIARFDFRFEKNLAHTTAKYSLNDDGSVKVVNTGYNYIKEEWEVATAKGKFIESENVGRLKVSFFGPFYTSYNILSIDGDYEYALIVGKNRDYIWFLSRTPKMPDNVKAKYLAIAESLGYDLERLVWVDHEMEVAEEE